jgi:hypothetical protein
MRKKGSRKGVNDRDDARATLEGVVGKRGCICAPCKSGALVYKQAELNLTAL